jgi:topoisomerase-4 subunit A
MGKQLIPPDRGEVQEVTLREALEERYLAYALSTIMHRALPDAPGPRSRNPPRSSAT